MATLTQTNKCLEALKLYKKKYIKKQFSDLDESATRIMINSFLTEVLGYKELDDIKTEYNIRGEYADYVIQLKRKKQFVIEVKSIELDLNERHLRQSLAYATNEGIDWIILTNGKSFQFYRVMFEKPIRTEKVITIEFTDASPKMMKDFAEILVLFTKKSVMKDAHELYWQRSIALSPNNMAKLLYCEDVTKILKRELKKTTSIYFEPEIIKSALLSCINSNISTDTLRYKSTKNNKTQ
jgi:hypothetical protein